MNRASCKKADNIIAGVLSLSVGISILTTLSVLLLLGRESFTFFQQVSIVEFLFSTDWQPLIEPKRFGVLALVSGTLIIVVFSILFALPFGILIATYLSEYASARSRSIVKPFLEILAGIPTVVYGYFALTFVTPMLAYIFPSIEVFNALSASIVVAIMILPMISSLCDDAFTSIPPSLREGGYALGATTLEVITQILMPAAGTRVLAAVVLAISRAIGETMAVTLAAGMNPHFGFNPLESVQTMTSYIIQVSLGDTPAGGLEYLSSYAVGTLLFLMTLTMNYLGTRMIKKVEIEDA